MLISTSARMRAIAIGASLLAYVLVFVPLYRIAGGGVAALSALPAAVIGWCLGRRAGLLGAALLIALNTILLNLAGVQGWDAVLQVGGGPGSMTLLLIGVCSGWIGTVIGREKGQAAELMREREALKQALEHARAYEALGTQEVRLRLLAEQVPALIWTTDSRLRFTSSMGAGLADLGVRPNALAGTSLYSFFQTDDPTYQPIQAHCRALAGEPSIFEIEWAGQMFRTQVEPFLDPDGAIIGTIAVALNITDRKLAEAALRRRDAILEAVSFVARQFLETTSWTHTMQAVLEHLGAASGVSRVYIFENHAGEDGAIYADQRYEWAAPGVDPQLDNPTLQNFAYQNTGFARWEAHLRRDDLIYGHVRTFPDRERALLESHGIRSILVVPIFAGHDWWGHIGFDQCDSERDWSTAEVDAIRAAAGIIGATIQRDRALESLRGSEQRHRSLFLAAERQTQELALLDRVRTALARDLDLQVIFRTVVETIAATFGYSQVSLYLLRENVLHLQHQVGYDQVIERIPINEGISGRVVRTGLPALLDDVRSDPTFLGAISGIVSEICIPLFDQGRVVGILNVESTGGVRLTEADFRLIIAIGEHVNIAIERARLYAEVYSSEAELRALFEAMTDVIFVLDRDGRYLKIAPTNPLLLYKPAPELIGKTIHESLPRPQADLFLSYIHRALDGRQTITLEYSLPIGEAEVWFSSSISPMLEDAVIWVARDVTRSKLAEDERIAFERKMLETQKLESLGVMAGGIAHDFNNLLMAILGNTSLAILDLPPASPVLESLQQIEHAARRAADLTRQMLAYSGKGHFVIEELDLNRLIQEIRVLLNASISKDVTLRYDLSEELPPIIGDASQLRQILTNLVVNAAEALGDAGGTIAVRTGVRHADSAYLATTHLAPDLPAGAYAFLEVADSGPGMEQATLAKIFEPFFTTKFTGRGLGLPAVLGIVRGHQGAVSVQSEPGRGTTFTILLPVALREKAEGSTQQTGEHGMTYQPQPSHHHAAPALAQTVLVVDDEESVRSVAARLLERSGFTVLTATDGRSGVEAFRAHADAISAVLLDMTMPQMNGEETLRAIHEIRPDARIVIMSGYDEQEISGRFVSLAPAGFLQKPFTPGDLREKIRQITDAPNHQDAEGARP